MKRLIKVIIFFAVFLLHTSTIQAADFNKLDWYQASTPLSISHFNNSLTDFSSSLNNGIAQSKPQTASSGGSSFSGGGGGGGSW